jgi:hypothetical protein
MPRIIYVLTNEAMPGLVKIGLTSDSVESRIANLSASTGVPLPFECHFAAEIPEGVNLEKIEKTLHQLFAEHRINLAALGIQVGDELVLSRDENIKAVVLDGNKISYQGEILSLSAAALKALQEMGYRSTSVSGSDYWMFEGELLDERRIRLEAQQFEKAPTA